MCAPRALDSLKASALDSAADDVVADSAGDGSGEDVVVGEPGAEKCK